MQEHFFRLTDFIAQRAGAEGFLARYSGERSRFVRFNRAAIRQPGTVEQHFLTVELFRGRKHLSHRVAITGGPDDEQRLDTAIADLQEMLSSAQDDPHFLVNTCVQSTERHSSDRHPGDDAVIPAILNAVAGHDFVGF
jgi:hypothetical protein